MNYLFVDLETTGLDPLTDKIVEVGMIVTNHLFQPVDSLKMVLHTEPEDWLNAPEIVLNMHKDNGLHEESVHSTVKLEEAEQIIVTWLMNCRWLGSKPVMCGNGVHFDRMFLRQYMPQVHELFHYRNFDVSTLKQILLATLPEWEFPAQEIEIHRAIPDCLDAATFAGEFQSLFASLLQVESTQPNIMRRLVRRPES